MACPTDHSNAVPLCTSMVLYLTFVLSSLVPHLFFLVASGRLGFVIYVIFLVSCLIVLHLICSRNILGW